MKKFNLKSLENTFDKIDNIQKGINNKEKSIIKTEYKKYNNKAIETILSVLMMCFEQDYLNAAGEYYEIINDLSDTYLLGSEWYMGREYTREYYFNSLNESIKYKLIFLIHFLSSIYKK